MKRYSKEIKKKKRRHKLGQNRDKLSFENIIELFGLVDFVRFDNRYFLKGIEFKGEPYGAGLYLGCDNHWGFDACPALSEVLSKNCDSKIFVNNKAEWLFLCGRDILQKSVEKGRVVNGEFVLVQNSRDENLGIGQIVGKVVKNYLDKGKYLRMER